MKVSGNSVGRILMKHGLAPENCASAEIVVDPGKALRIRYDVMLTLADCAKLATVFQEIADLEKKGVDGEQPARV